MQIITKNNGLMQCIDFSYVSENAVAGNEESPNTGNAVKGSQGYLHY